MPAPRRRSTSTAWCASTTCAPAATSATSRSTSSTSTTAASRATPSRRACDRRCSRSADAYGAHVKVVEVPPGPAGAGADRRRDLRPGRRRPPRCRARLCARCSTRRRASSMSTTAASPRRRSCVLLVDRRKAALLGVPQEAIVGTLRAGLGRRGRRRYLHDETKYPAAGDAAAACRAAGRSRYAAATQRAHSASGKLVPLRELVTVERLAARTAASITRTCCRWTTSSATWPAASTARCTACSRCAAQMTAHRDAGRRLAGRILHPPAG